MQKKNQKTKKLKKLNKKLKKLKIVYFQENSYKILFSSLFAFPSKMINESTQDPSKPPILRAFDKDNSLNLLTNPLFHESKDFEDLNNPLPNYKTKGFTNSNFPNYNSSNLGFMGGYGRSMFGQIEKHDIQQNNYLNDLNSNKKDISFSKKHLDFEFTNQNQPVNFHNSLNLSHNHQSLNYLENNLFYHGSNNAEESHFGENDKNLKHLFAGNLGTNINNKLNLMGSSNFDSNLYVNF